VVDIALHQGFARRSAYAATHEGEEDPSPCSSNLERHTMKILLAVDGSKFTKHMLAYLAAHDELIGPENRFSVMTVVTSLPHEVSHFIDRRTINGYYKEKADEVLSPVLAFAAQQGWTVNTIQTTGHAAEAISNAAKEGDFDLLVMGSHGHSTLGSLVLGSVVHGVMARCKTPMLIIR
jgi:nucleotide-binding universal stress UspA family protein